MLPGLEVARQHILIIPSGAFPRPMAREVYLSQVAPCQFLPPLSPFLSGVTAFEYRLQHRMGFLPGLFDSVGTVRTDGHAV
jgi:hypothetical protein